MSEKIIKLMVIFVVVTLFLASALPIGVQAKVEYPLVLKTGHVVPPDFLYDAGLKEFKRIVEKATNGKIRVEIYPLAQLGSERELIEACQMGVVDMVVSNTAPCTGFVPEIGVFSLPLIYQSWNAAYKVWDGPIGQEMLDKFEGVGLKALSLWDGGQRGIIGQHPIRTPDDMRGLKVRCMEDPVMLAFFRAMGALPTAIPWGECYTSLQQGVVDELETCIQMMQLNKFNEVAKYVTFTNHYWTPAVHVINLDLWNSLPLRYKRLFQAASYVGREVCRMDILPGGAHANDITLKKLDEANCEIIEPDIEAFQKVAKLVWKQFEDEFGKERIQEIAQTTAEPVERVE